jgi:hypothetical protein
MGKVEYIVLVSLASECFCCHYVRDFIGHVRTALRVLCLFTRITPKKELLIHVLELVSLAKYCKKTYTSETSKVLNRFWPSGVFKVNICGKVLLVNGSFVKVTVNLRTSL